MDATSQLAAEGTFSWAERWAPKEAEIWHRWRMSLTAEQRADALLPLQAALSGLVAFGRLENHPPSVESEGDFRPHLLAVRVTYDWALGLIDRLRGPQARRQPLTEPLSSLSDLEGSLMDALRTSEPPLEPLLLRPAVDRGAFSEICDLFAHDLSENAFFKPPDALEFANVDELVGGEGRVPKLRAWHGEAAQMTVVIAFLTLLRDHRFLGIADHQIGRRDGLYRAHVVVAAVRRELRQLTRFLLEQGVRNLADDLGEELETVTADLEAAARAGLDQALPPLKPGQSYGAHAEALRGGICEARAALKDAAKRLHNLHRLGRAKLVSASVPKRLDEEIWGFRFILRAFIDKAFATLAVAGDPQRLGNLSFTEEFVRHFRAFGPGLIKDTDYLRREPLVRAISMFHASAPIDAATLDVAIHECNLFLKHLDEALAEATREHSFDKREAAEALRDYLRNGRDREARVDAPAGAFGLDEPHRAQAS